MSFSGENYLYNHLFYNIIFVDAKLMTLGQVTQSVNALV